MERKTHPRGRAYQCLHCVRKGKTEINSKTRMEDHIYRYHVPNDEQPFWCKLCQFRSRSRESFFRHVQSYVRHKNVMKEKGFRDSEPFLVCNDQPYILGEKDWKMLDKEESTNWWGRKSDVLKTHDIVEKALHLEVPEIYYASKYIQDMDEKILEGDIENDNYGGNEARKDDIDMDEAETEDSSQRDSSGSGDGHTVAVSETVGDSGVLDLRIVFGNKAESDSGYGAGQVEMGEGRDKEMEGSEEALDLRIVKQDRKRKVIDFEEYKKRRSATECQSEPLDLTIGMKEDGKGDSVKRPADDKRKEDSGEKKGKGKTSCENKVAMEAEEGVMAADVIEKEMEEENDLLGAELPIRENRVTELSTETSVETEIQDAETHKNEQVDVEARDTDMARDAVAREGLMVRVRDKEVRSRKRIRQSLKRYRDVSVSSTSSESSSSSESDSGSSRERRFTNILGDLIRKSGNIVGEQIIANASLINNLQKSVDELRKEVASLRQEIKAQKGGKEGKDKDKHEHYRSSRNECKETKKEGMKSVVNKRSDRKENPEKKRKEVVTGGGEMSKRVERQKEIQSHRPALHHYRGRNNFRGRGREFVRF